MGKTGRYESHSPFSITYGTPATLSTWSAAGRLCSKADNRCATLCANYVVAVEGMTMPCAPTARQPKLRDNRFPERDANRSSKSSAGFCKSKPGRDP